MKFLKIASAGCGIFVLLFVVLAVIAMVGLGKAVNDSQNSGKQAAANIDQVSYGMSKDEVISALGTPEDSQEMASQFMGETNETDCIYYGTISENSYQLCFTNNQLDTINKW